MRMSEISAPPLLTRSLVVISVSDGDSTRLIGLTQSIAPRAKTANRFPERTERQAHVHVNETRRDVTR